MPRKMLPARCQPQHPAGSLGTLGSADHDPAVLFLQQPSIFCRNPVSLAGKPFSNTLPRVLPQPLPRARRGHCSGWHAAILGTASTHQGGQQQPSETWLGREGGGRRFVYIALLFQAALGLQ